MDDFPLELSKLSTLILFEHKYDLLFGKCVQVDFCDSLSTFNLSSLVSQMNICSCFLSIS